MKIQNITVAVEYRRERGEYAIRYGLTEQIKVEESDVPTDIVAEARRRLMTEVHGMVERAINHVSPPQ